MASHFEKLVSKGLISDAPKHINNNIQYEVIMGSIAYGVSHDSSDMDIYGFSIPPKDYIFPHLRGEILGFDDYEIKFNQYQKHHIFDKSALNGAGRSYDITIYSIVKYFRMLLENNPNIIDSLFVPRNCVLHCTRIGEIVRENHLLFLHKGCWQKFKGYAYGQIHKIRTKNPEGKRKDIIAKYGYDVKFAYHVVRLLNEVEQLLIEQNLDLTRNAEQLKAIRRGEWTLEQLENYFTKKENELESVYLQSQLPQIPDKDKVRKLLFNCLEQHFGSLATVVRKPNISSFALHRIKKIIDEL